ncbi:MAG: c-type cytochrome [Rhodospirillaceae bacterium]
MVMAKAGLSFVAVMLSFITASSMVSAQGDPERGALLYRECAPCHSLFRDGRQAGPALRGVFGRQAGMVSDFSYSEALRASGIIWTDETLKAWLSDPLTFIPGSRKRGHSVWRDERLDDVLAYLKRAQGLLNN